MRAKTHRSCSLYSFAKYLELLIYSPSLCTITPKLCEHTSPESSTYAVNDTSPQTRFNIIRHFKHGERSVRFTLSASPAVFELRMPRLQIVKGRIAAADGSASGGSIRGEPVKKRPTGNSVVGTIPEEKNAGGTAVDNDKRTLRKEIKEWWQGVAEHLDRLVSI
jgi:1-phosphatidylinositol-3-phosphate 5-kinase